MRFRILTVVFLALLAAGAASLAPALADARIALIIGNADYGADMGQLQNPENDARLVGDSLRRVGFDVVVVENADQKAMKRAISEFGKRLVAAGPHATALFYYAGHGVQVDGTNYLVPIHASISSEADVDLESVAADTVLRQMEFAGTQLNILVLDACRNNPLARSSRSGARGLARMDAPTGSFIAYSTAPGAVALDGADNNSPFAIAFAAQLQQPGSEIAETFRNVRTRVMAATENQQVPWDSSSVTAPFYFVPEQVAAAAPAAEPVQTAGIASTTEVVFWESVKDSTRASDFEAYLEEYPDGVFVKLARSRLAALGGGDAATRDAAAPVAQAPAPQTTAPQTAAPQSAALPQAAAPADAVTDLDVVMFAAKLGNLRQQPSTTAPVLKQLAVGDQLQVTGKIDGKDWYRVGLADGQVGYVHASVVTAEQPAVQQPTVQQAAVQPVAPAPVPAPTPAAAPAPAPAAQSVPPPPAAPLEITALDQQMYVAKKAKIRAAPATTAKILQQIAAGKPVQVTGKVVGADWYRIALPGSEDAYVHASMLTSTKPEPQDGTPVAPPIAPADQAAWDAVKASTTRADFESYLAKFPNGTFAAQAQAQIAALDAAAAAQAPQSPLADGTILLSPDVSRKLQDFLGDNRVLSGRKRAYFFVSVDGLASGSFMCPDKCADHTGGGYLSEGSNIAYDDLRRRAEKACKAAAKTECVLLYINLDERRPYRLAGQ